jgi:hypothetical protein
MTAKKREGDVMNLRSLFVVGAMGVLGTTGVAYAKDAVRADVTDAAGAVVTENGAFSVPGTYAVGTLKLHYFVTGHAFPPGTYAAPEICFDTLAAKSKPETRYPATMYLDQIGGEEVVLMPSNNAPTFYETGHESCVTLDVSIPSYIAEDPDYQEDGTELVGNLRLSTPPRTHLDTVTTIKVHLTLVHPSETACVVPLHFVSDNDFGANVSATGLSLQYNTQQQTVSSDPTRPSHTVALVNTCEDDVTVDLGTAINGNFGLFHTNAIRTTTANQEYEDIDALLAGQQDLPGPGVGGPWCFEGVTVPGNQTYILAQVMSIRNDADFPGAYADSIGRGLGSWDYDGFTFATYAPVAGGCGTGAPSADVDPNSGSTSIPVSRVTFSGPGAPDTETRPESE